MRKCISSANVNVPTRHMAAVFDHFNGMGSFMRNAKLKLAVYEVLARGVNNHV